jgi:hypothetical protein
MGVYYFCVHRPLFGGAVGVEKCGKSSKRFDLENIK